MDVPCLELSFWLLLLKNSTLHLGCGLVPEASQIIDVLLLHVVWPLWLRALLLGVWAAACLTWLVLVVDLDGL